MILYSKNGDFLGIGKDELSFLGYEDLDEFKSIHSDIADLFVNRPGYIFKFKNFSWIDYALHSGAPKKSVIIKLKSGNEVEVPLKIKELFLYSPTDNEDLYYSVEFTNNISQNSSSQSESNFIQATPAPQIDIPEPEPMVIDSFNEPKQDISYEEDFTQEQNKDISVDFDTIQNEIDIEEDKPVLKLKVDNDIFEESEEQAPIKIESNYEEELPSTMDITSDYVKEETVEPKLDIISDYVEETPISEISLKEQTFEEDITFENRVIEDENDDEDIDFDLVQCVDELGLDMSLIGELITDYMEKIEKTIPIIKSSLEESNEVVLKDSIYKLKGISDNLHMYQLSNKLENILNAKDTEEKNKELEKFEKIVEKFRGELI